MLPCSAQRRLSTIQALSLLSVRLSIRKKSISKAWSSQGLVACGIGSISSAENDAGRVGLGRDLDGRTDDFSLQNPPRLRQQYGLR